MKLSTRLVVGYGYLVVLLLVVAGSSLVGFFDLSGGIEQVLVNNVRSVESTTRLLEALERQDSATLTDLMRGESDSSEMAAADAQFDQALQEVRSNITSQEERQIIEQLEQTYRSYRQARSALLTSRPDQPLEDYRAETFPRFQSVKQKVFALLEHNHQAMAEADRQARRGAIRYGSWLGFLVVVTLGSFIFLTRGLRQVVLERIAAIQSVAEAVAVGETRRRVHTSGEDELAVIAEQFNQALDRYEALKGEYEGEVRAIRQRVIGLLNTHYTEAILYAVDGQRLAQTGGPGGDWLDEKQERQLVEVGRALGQQEGGPQGDEPQTETVELEGGLTARLIVVRTPDGRRVGWIAERSASAG